MFLHDNYHENMDLERMKDFVARTHKGAKYIVRMRRMFIEKVSRADSDGKQAHYYRPIDREFLENIFYVFNRHQLEKE